MLSKRRLLLQENIHIRVCPCTNFHLGPLITQELRTILTGLASTLSFSHSSNILFPNGNTCLQISACLSLFSLLYSLQLFLSSKTISPCKCFQLKDFCLSTWRTSRSTNHTEYDLYLKCKCWNWKEKLLGRCHITKCCDQQCDQNVDQQPSDPNVLKPMLNNYLKQFSWSLASAGASLVSCRKYKLFDSPELYMIRVLFHHQRIRLQFAVHVIFHSDTPGV